MRQHKPTNPYIKLFAKLSVLSSYKIEVRNLLIPDISQTGSDFSLTEIPMKDIRKVKVEMSMNNSAEAQTKVKCLTD